MAATLKDVVAATGLSKPTVAWILRDPAAPYKQETCELVWATAKRLGYRPNAAAKAISSGRFGCVVLILGADPGRGYASMDTVEAVQEELAQHEMYLAIARLPDQQLSEAGFVPKVLSQNMADGMIINYTFDIPTRMMQLIEQSHAPAVWLNTKLEYDCARPDDFSAGVEAAKRLLALGHRRIAFLSIGDVETENLRHYSFEDRRDGYIRTMREAGLAPVVVERSLPLEQHEKTIREVLMGPERPSAVIAAEVGSASMTITTALLAGLRVPQDISVLAICRQWKASAAGLRMTSLLVPAREVGKCATEMMLRKIEKPLEQIENCSVPFIWMDGQTCAGAK